jgi:hypothetical protein
MAKGYCSGLLIIDATAGSKSLLSVLWYTLDDILFFFNGSDWERRSELEKLFKMRTYQNNLKGAWNEWKT